MHVHDDRPYCGRIQQASALSRCQRQRAVLTRKLPHTSIASIAVLWCVAAAESYIDLDAGKGVSLIGGGANIA